MSSKLVGERVLAIRKAAGLNQRAFAERLTTSSGYISGVESGTTMPGGEFLLRLQAEFQVDPTWLLTGQVAGAAVAAPISEGDRVLLDNFHAAPEQVQAGIKTALGAFADAPRQVGKRKKAA